MPHGSNPNICPGDVGYGLINEVWGRFDDPIDKFHYAWDGGCGSPHYPFVQPRNATFDFDCLLRYQGDDERAASRQ